MDNGGMLFESKWEIFKLIPEKYYPTTIAVRQGDAVDAIVKMMSRHEMNYPVVAKPDRGERGWGVKILRDVDDLLAYHEANGSDYLIQAYVDYPLELSIMYVHIPGQPHGRITSLTRKEMLAVTGDGSSTIAELIKADYRALVQYPSLAQMPGVHMGEVLPAGERRELVPYGNHCRGAAFYDERAEITPALEDAINHIASQIEGFNYGRFDLRCTSLDVLAAGRNFSILELNGGSAEPAHIYEAGFSFWEGQRTLMRHFRLLREVAVVYMKQGQGTIGWKDFIALFKARKAYRKRVRFT